MFGHITFHLGMVHYVLGIEKRKQIVLPWTVRNVFTSSHKATLCHIVCCDGLCGFQTSGSHILLVGGPIYAGGWMAEGD